MKTKNNTHQGIRKIRSLRELHKEKTRLQGEVTKTEEHIKSGYRHLIDAFTFRNILHPVIEDIATTRSAFSKAFSVGKGLFGKLKKKKKKKNKYEPAENTQPDTSATLSPEKEAIQDNNPVPNS